MDYDDDQGDLDTASDGLGGFDQGEDSNQPGDLDTASDGLGGFDQGEDSNQPMDLINDEEDIGERTPLKRGRDRAESGNPRLKKSGRQTIAHGNAPTDDPDYSNPFKAEDPNRQGASRTTGGIFRGKATGNHFNWGDAPQFMDDGPQIQPIPMGKVFLFGSRDKKAHPHLSITTQTDTQLPPLLKKLSAKYSPIKSKCIILYN
jgi:hypothetical protein